MQMISSFIKIFLGMQVVVYGDMCQDLCNVTPNCNSEEHAHGSYCKSWQTPQVCFGLYYTDASNTAICFEPKDLTNCSESTPVPCSL